MTARHFAEFDLANPDVWALFCQFADEAWNAGHRRYSADAVLHRVRWETTVTERKALHLNNDWTAHYARKFLAAFPERAGFFETRALRASVADAA
ncbi:MAG: hypothetical protein IT462_11920 [Planctomycetes bacterium]|nr:hypothetical protein [Planctomycetota bacterium]